MYGFRKLDLRTQISKFAHIHTHTHVFLEKENSINGVNKEINSETPLPRGTFLMRNTAEL